MRRVSLAARRARYYLRRPPGPRWARPARHVALAALGLGLLAGLGVWAHQAALPTRVAAAVEGTVLDWTRDLGLVVSEVFVDGRDRTDRQALRGALDVDLGQPILAVDLAATKARLEALRWVERASVARLLPDGLHIDLVERRPLALWQHDGRFVLIDRNGDPIAGEVTDRASAARYDHLRIVVGERAPTDAARLFALLSTEPELWARVIAATRIGDRRWSLRLDNRIDVLLPEGDVLGAWRFLAARAREDRLLERAVTVVDLRFLPERLRLRLDPAVLEDRPA